MKQNSDRKHHGKVLISGPKFKITVPNFDFQLAGLEEKILEETFR